MGGDTWIQAIVGRGLHHVSRLLIMSSFSFDMTGFTDPSQFIPFLQSYVTYEAYYLYDGKNPICSFPIPLTQPSRASIRINLQRSSLNPPFSLPSLLPISNIY
jgi:hypothetical protein